MSRKFLIISIRFLVISFCYSMKYPQKDSNQLLLDFTCAVAKDELEKHPEMRTIAMVELENNFPSDFSAKVLKCLPEDVAKISINPHTHVCKNNSLILTKETMMIYIVTHKVEWPRTFYYRRFNFEKNFPIVNHLSKHLIITSGVTQINTSSVLIRSHPNVVQIYEKNRRVIAKSLDTTKDLLTFETFEGSQRENLSQILFPDKTKNLNGQKIYAVWSHDGSSTYIEDSLTVRPFNKWIPYLDLIAEKLNATLNFSKIELEIKDWNQYRMMRRRLMKELIDDDRLDFYLNAMDDKFDLESYNNRDWCFLAPLPDPYSITDQILFLPMDKSCWMWLGITIAVSTLIWRISEGHWNFAFGFFSYFMGQAQLIIRIQTNRLTMKILLQLLIFAIFIFSNGYQSLVTSFMLNPMQQKLLKTIDDVLDSNLKIVHYASFNIIFQHNPKYQRADRDGRIIILDDIMENRWTLKIQEMNLAYIQTCKHSKIRVEIRGNGKSWNGTYVVNDIVSTSQSDLFTAPFHPYIEKFQEIMDRSFEAGLHQAWERFFWEVYREHFKIMQIEEENDILDLRLIAPSLYILLFGFIAAVLALLCEIFCKDFVSELSREYLGRKWREIFERLIIRN